MINLGLFLFMALSFFFIFSFYTFFYSRMVKPGGELTARIGDITNKLLMMETQSLFRCFKGEKPNEIELVICHSVTPQPQEDLVL